MAVPLAPVGPYTLIRELGRGSNGVVYLAHRGDPNVPVALKLFLGADQEGLARFDLEALVSSQLAHPGIVGTLESGAQRGIKWLAMEFVAGETLQDRLARGPLHPAEARHLVADLADAIDFAHQRGVIHRDLKPANIMLASDGRPRVMDFGLAQTQSSSLTRTGDRLGTPYYMAPEQFLDSKHIDARADVYALGVIFYECLAGVRPFQGATIPEVASQKKRGLVTPLPHVAPDVPANLAAVCHRAMAREADDRFDSARALLDELLDDDPPHPPRAERATLAVLATLAVTSTLVLALVVWTRSRSRSPLDIAPQVVEVPSASPPPQEAPADARREVFRQAYAVTAEAAPARLHELGGQLTQALPAELLDLQADQELARDALAGTTLAVAARLSMDRAPYQVALELYELAEALALTPTLVAEAQLERASYLFRRGRLQQATEVASPLSSQPGRLGFQARYVAAYGQLWQDRYEIGLGGLRDIWHDDPDGVVGLNAGAVFNSHTGHNDVGEGLALRSLEQDPTYVDAWISLTFCRNDQFRLLGPHKLDEGLESNDEALRLMPDHPRVYMSRAFILGNMGRTDEAIANYDTLIELTEPRPFGRGLKFRGNHLLQRGDLQSAFTDFDRAVDRNADDLESLILRGVVHEQLGESREAEADWIHAARRDRRGLENVLRRFPPQLQDRIRGAVDRR